MSFTLGSQNQIGAVSADLNNIDLSGHVDELFSLPCVVLSGTTAVINNTNSENLNNSDVLCTTSSLGDTTEARLIIKP